MAVFGEGCAALFSYTLLFLLFSTSSALLVENNNVFSTSSALLVENNNVPLELRTARYCVARRMGTKLGASFLTYRYDPRFSN